MKRPSIALCVIAKNEEKNLERLTKSVEGCFDNLYLTDTGSTDQTVSLATSLGWKVSHFDWIEDFAAARNHSFSQASEDYIMWLDLDDVLTGRDAFIHWRNTAMALSDYWLACYDYAHDIDGKPVVSFARERVVKNLKKPMWKHFLHEGIPFVGFSSMNQLPTTTWKVSHQRTSEDLAKDKGRNLRIFENHMKNGNKLDTRMRFYYGKELFEINRPDEAIGHLIEASTAQDCEPHDRILSIQYATFSCMAAANMLNPQNETAKEKIDKYLIDAINIAKQGLSLDQHRAEFWTAVGDCYVKLGKTREAIPWFTAAMACEPTSVSGGIFATPIFSFPQSNTTYPRSQLIRCFFHLGQIEKAKKLAEEVDNQWPSEESKKMLDEVNKVHDISVGYKTAKENDAIVFTCPPAGMFEWDEEIYKSKGMGGSETACIEMAKHLKLKTGRPVIVFNNRNSALTSSSGVEYRSALEVNDYMSKHKPAVHIAWRHNLKCTDAKTYLWCHDLYTPGVESQHNFDKHICLSPFHADYVHSMQGLPKDKIWISRNGIVPERFARRKEIAKNPMKIVYPSSPDRGLERLIPILDIVRKTHPVELHVFYGFDNLYKSGPVMTDLANRLKVMVSERPWITYHGNTEQNILTNHLMEASLWVHPANFIESFCISAIEMLCAGVYPITRSLGALQDTLKSARESGMAHLFDVHDLIVPETEYEMWAQKIVESLDTKAWEKVSVDPAKYSWASVADEWIKEMGL